MRLVHDISDIWISPSTPGRTSTKAPKSINLVTSPVTLSPGFKVAAACSHGSADICFKPSEILPVCLSTLNKLRSSTSPTLNSVDGSVTRDQDIYPTCIKQSIRLL